ncbi:MAG: FAD-dependent oxidoreductase, partial [Dehalococcoidia bacterium]
MTTGAEKTIIILGGGIGGIVTARRLRKRLGRRHRVVVVDRSDQHLFAPSLLWLMVGERRPEAIQRDLSRLERKGIEVVRGEVTAIDPEHRRVTVDGRDLEAD